MAFIALHVMIDSPIGSGYWLDEDGFVILDETNDPIYD